MTWKRKTRIKEVGECTIVECPDSRCPEYFSGKCEKCLDICALENWKGWNRVEETGVDLSIWKNMWPLYRTYLREMKADEESFVFIKYKGSCYCFDDQAYLLMGVGGCKVYEIEDHLVWVMKNKTFLDIIVAESSNLSEYYFESPMFGRFRCVDFERE